MSEAWSEKTSEWPGVVSLSLDGTEPSNDMAGGGGCDQRRYKERGKSKNK